MMLVHVKNMVTLDDAKNITELQFGRMKWTRKGKSAVFRQARSEGVWNEETRELVILRRNDVPGQGGKHFSTVHNARANDKSWLDLGQFSTKYNGWSFPMLAIYRPQKFVQIFEPTRCEIKFCPGSRLDAEHIEVYQKASAIKLPAILTRGRLVKHFYSECMSHGVLRYVRSVGQLIPPTTR
jgi:hypothetical protein